MLKELIENLKELEEVGIIKNFKIENGKIDFELCVPKEFAMNILDDYIFENYGIIF